MRTEDRYGQYQVVDCFPLLWQRDDRLLLVQQGKYYFPQTIPPWSRLHITKDYDYLVAGDWFGNAFMIYIAGWDQFDPLWQWFIGGPRVIRAPQNVFYGFKKPITRRILQEIEGGLDHEPLGDVFSITLCLCEIAPYWYFRAAWDKESKTWFVAGERPLVRAEPH